MKINKNVFREYDVRGIYPTDINEELAYIFGQAFGTYIKKFNKNKCVVGHDNRLSSNSLEENLIKGIISTGIDVVRLGLCTTPMYYYACIKLNIPSGVMVTASHNPKDDNGFKFAFDERGNAKGEMIQEFLEFLLEENFDQGVGSISTYDIEEEYYDLLISSINVNNGRRLKVIIDAGNGTTSEFAKKLYSKLDNVEIIPLFCESDPTFPNHHPDPAVEENLTILKEKVVEFNADVGIAFDGDGDRVGIIDEKGNYIPADKYMIMVVRDLLPNNLNKKVLYDVKCSKALTDEIKRLGGESIVSRTGNSYTKANTKDYDCIFGGEYSGHLYFRDKFLGFDSGMYAGLRMIEMLSKSNFKTSELLDNIPIYLSTPELKIPSTDTKKKEVVAKILEYAKSKNYKIIDVDGVRCEFPDGWGLVRYSNTGPNITARFEGKTDEIKNKIEEEFMNLINLYNK